MEEEQVCCPLDESAKGHELLEQVADYYHRRFFECEPAIDFLRKLHLYNEKVISRLRIGFADRTLGLQLPNKQIASGKRIRNNLTEVGIYRESGHAHLNGCVTFPVADFHGKMIQIYGRRIDARSPKIEKDLTLTSTTDCLFNPESFQNTKIILTDGVINALSFICNGIENATCVLSGKHTSSALLSAIKQSKVSTVYLAFESSEDGEQALHQTHTELKNLGIETLHIRFPWGMGANDFLQAKGSDALAESYRKAQWLGQGVQSSPASDIQPNTGNVGKPLKRHGEYYTASMGDCEYRIGGLQKNHSVEALKVTLRATCEGLTHVDNIDLYKEKDRRRFIDCAHDELRMEKALFKRDLGRLLHLLEVEQEQRLALAEQETPEQISINSNDEQKALELLRTPELLENIGASFEHAGLVGESTNKLTAFLAMLSSKLPKPLGLVIQSSSASGKSTLMDSVLSFFPPEQQLKYSAITGQSLFYQQDLKHKILAISEEIGFEKAGGSLKLLQSQGHLSISTTSKDPKSGRLKSIDYHVQGPVAIVFTTTSIDIDEELMNRCLLLTTDESKEQTKRIHDLQREARTIEGIVAAEKRQDTVRLMQNALRLIRPMRIVNPYARYLTFSCERTRTRRDHEKYLTLIDTIALLHQYQRELITHKVNGRTVEMLPVTLKDIETANRIAGEVIHRSLDELPPQTRLVLESIKLMVQARAKAESLDQRQVHFSRREVREFTGVSQMQVRRHIERLQELEYLQARGGSNGVTMRYELMVDAKAKGSSQHMELIDVSKLKTKATQ